MGEAPSEGRLVIIDRCRKAFVARDRPAGLQDLPREEPVDRRERAAALVVRRDHEVHVPRLVVRVAQTEDGQAHVEGFPEGLLIRRGVRDDDRVRLHVLRQAGVRQGPRDEAAREDLRADRLREQLRGLLPVLPRGDDEDPLRTEAAEELRGLADPGVRLLDIEDVQPVDPHLVDEGLHVRALLLRPDVHAGRQVDVFGHEEPLDAGPFLFLHHVPPWSCSSIRMSSLSFAVLSPPTVPVLIPRLPKATARWAIVSSVVSPLRWDTTVAYPALWARSTAARASLGVPIWFGLIRIAFPARASIPRRRRSTFVTKRSSPMTVHLDPRASVSRAKPSKSSWSSGSSRLHTP